MVFPSGESRTSKTPGSIDGVDTSPVAMLMCTTCPPSTVTTAVTEASVAYDTMPAAPSRARSRRRNSSGVSADRSVASVRGSSSSRSTPVAVSITHSVLTESEPPCDRTNNTRAPSGETVKLRGSPRVSRCVRAYWRGKVSLTRAMYPRHRGELVYRPIRSRTCRDQGLRLCCHPMRGDHRRECT